MDTVARSEEESVEDEWDGVDPEDRSDDEMKEEFWRLFGLMPKRTKGLIDRYQAIGEGGDEDGWDEFHRDITTFEQSEDAVYMIEMVHELIARGVWVETIKKGSE